MFGEPPPGYVAGIGRGATGFTTRSDIGPARLPSRFTQPQGSSSNSTTEEENEQETNQTFDEWSGYGGNILGRVTGVEDEEDKEADSIWSAISQRMENKKKRKNVTENENQTSKYAKYSVLTSSLDSQKPKIAATFSDIKEELKYLSKEEWNIPEVSGSAVNSKNPNRLNQQMYERYTAAPDQLILDKLNNNTLKFNNTADTGKMNQSGTLTDLRALGEMKETIMKSKLQSLEDSISGTSTVDPKNYMSGLDSQIVLGSEERVQIKKYRKLFKRATQVRPENIGSWMGRARLEELAGDLKKACKVIEKACNIVTDSEELWLESIRLNEQFDKQNKNNILAQSVCCQALQACPKSVKLWLKACELESDLDKRKKILRKAIQAQPESLQLWKEAIDLETEEQSAKTLLESALEYIPNSIDLWLALAKLNPYKDAKKVLSRAISKLPREPLIWISGAYLEEEHYNTETTNTNGKNSIQKVIKNAIETLKKLKEEGLDRDEWIGYAKNAEKSEHFITCEAIINEMIGYSLTDVRERKSQYIRDANNLATEGFMKCAKAIFECAIREFPTKKSVWMNYYEFQIKYQKEDTLTTRNLLKQATTECPSCQNLWLIRAKYEWKVFSNIQNARDVLQEGFEQLKIFNILLAAVKLEYENEEYLRARLLLFNSRCLLDEKKEVTEQADAGNIYIRSALFERYVFNNESMRKYEILNEGLSKYPKEPKLYLMKGQLEEGQIYTLLNMNSLSLEKYNDISNEVSLIYEAGIEKCPNSIPLWTSLIKLHFNPLLKTIPPNINKARAIIDRALLKNPSSATLWLSLVKLEYYVSSTNGVGSVNNTSLATLMKGIQAIGSNKKQLGVLWSFTIPLEIVQKRKSSCANALKHCDRDIYVISQIALDFYRERKIDKAKEWLKKALTIDSTNGDMWIYLYKIECLHGNQPGIIEEECKKAEPKFGEIWTFISKQLNLYGYEKLDSISILKKSLNLLDLNNNIFLTLVTTFDFDDYYANQLNV
ncbi:predicted protein [Naegleria gruberi]|uniref:Predicted protein n=1 Tax=Naegleria gruberi TaxID=5762 RepID=D2UZP1_NAEGR|nr:uncharacterized protein NAEGRDRAFT_29694 [Naegleria gruberi]EFC49970.1 predicted protein [Naegleria gruberi]|eukprot:XP_002682714.1 predicted protein [Naegleria gruberi strain NEG-M]